MTLAELEIEIQIMLSALKVTARKHNLVKEVSVQFVIEEFGVIICGVNRADYSLVKDIVLKQFGPGWRVVYVSIQGSLHEKKDEIIWEMMRSGYMRYIRTKYPRQFKELITMQNFGKKIVEKRLKIWDGAPKYRFLIEENKAVLKEAVSYVLSIDPSFFDYMPEGG